MYITGCKICGKVRKLMEICGKVRNLIEIRILPILIQDLKMK